MHFFEVGQKQQKKKKKMQFKKEKKNRQKRKFYMKIERELTELNVSKCWYMFSKYCKNAWRTNWVHKVRSTAKCIFKQKPHIHDEFDIEKCARAPSATHNHLTIRHFRLFHTFDTNFFYCSKNIYDSFKWISTKEIIKIENQNRTKNKSSKHVSFASWMKKRR